MPTRDPATGRFTRNEPKNVHGQDRVRTNLGRFAASMQVMLRDKAQEVAAEMQSEMRSGAPWDDITGMARQNLYAEVHIADLTTPLASLEPRRGQAYTGSWANRHATQEGGWSFETSRPGGLVIVAYGTTRQNYWLEVRTFSRKGRLAIIGPTVRRYGPIFLRRVQSGAGSLGL